MLHAEVLPHLQGSAYAAPRGVVWRSHSRTGSGQFYTDPSVGICAANGSGSDGPPWPRNQPSTGTKSGRNATPSVEHVYGNGKAGFVFMEERLIADDLHETDEAGP